MFLVKRNEPKRLLGIGERLQHFCLPEHRPSVTEEHQASSRVRSQRSRQIEHATSHRNDLQIARHAASILESKNSWGGIFKVYSCGTPGEDLWEVGHTKESMLRIQELQEITEVLDHFAMHLRVVGEKSQSLTMSAASSAF
jgi:hypothetical protein